MRRQAHKRVNLAQQVKLMKKAQVFKFINQGRNPYKKETSPGEKITFTRKKLICQSEEKRDIKSSHILSTNLLRNIIEEKKSLLQEKNSFVKVKRK
ncbi:hypothetical protein KSS87_021949 [Heliosperma pusillum]|nr:hypothetical protein KSS87_021949 [Heliosperma pusillum]